jgi:hypothetical protein
VNPRLRRALRLFGIAGEKVEAAQARLHDARRAAAQARDEVARCEAAWSRAANASHGAILRIADLERQSAHLRTLRLHIDAAARRVTEASTVERRCEAAVVDALRDQRKLELWLERIEQAARTVRQRP